MEDYSWILRGKQRRSILKIMDKEKIPTQISKESKVALNNTSDVLRSFVRRNIAVCINETEKTGRIYVLTTKGKRLKQRLSQ
jgi:predicted transcriptional regulator